MQSHEWDAAAHAVFRREKGNPEKGQWEKLKKVPDNWLLPFNQGELSFRMKLSLTGFKHVGVFPEQAVNWTYIYDQALTYRHPKILNLFAYTGASSLAARAANADVTHLDAVKQIVTWARENMEVSRQENIRWIVDDAMKFAKREARRGNKYNGIILDPPAYGRGPDGEKWLLEEHINELLEVCAEILSEDGFLVMSLYSLGFSALISENLINNHFPKAGQKEFGELYLPDNFGKVLPLGTFYRFRNQP